MTASTQNHPLATNAGHSVFRSEANGVACLRAKVTLPADYEVGDKFNLLKLPAEHRVVDAVLVAGDLDSGSGVVLDVGIVDTVQDPSDTTSADCIFDGSTVGQAGGVARASLASCFNIAARNYDRTVQLLVQVGAGGAQSADVELLLWVSPKQANGYDAAVVMPT